MTAAINVYDAKSQFSQLLTRAELGEEIVISRNGRPVARLMPLAPRRADRKPGALAGRLTIAEDFDSFSDDDAAEWYGA